MDVRPSQFQNAAEAIEEKKTQIKYLDKMVKLISKERDDPEIVNRLRKCLSNARACGDAPFLENFSKHVDNFTSYDSKKQTALTKEMKNFKVTVQRDLRALERTGQAVAPAPRGAKRGREEDAQSPEAAGEEHDVSRQLREVREEQSREFHGFIPTMQRAGRGVGDFVRRWRGAGAALTPLAIGIAKNLPALASSPSVPDFIGVCLSVAQDTATAAVFTTPTILIGDRALPHTEEKPKSPEKRIRTIHDE